MEWMNIFYTGGMSAAIGFGVTYSLAYFIGAIRPWFITRVRLRRLGYKTPKDAGLLLVEPEDGVNVIETVRFYGNNPYITEHSSCAGCHYFLGKNKRTEFSYRVTCALGKAGANMEHLECWLGWNVNGSPFRRWVSREHYMELRMSGIDNTILKDHRIIPIHKE